MTALWRLAVALTLCSCVADTNIGKDLAEGDASASGTEGGETGDETGTGAETGTGGGDATDAGGETDTTGDTGEPEVCAVQPEDSPCLACQKQNCCPAWEACHANSHCVCIVVCVGEGHSADACIDNCGQDNGEHFDVLVCTDGHCQDSCP